MTVIATTTATTHAQFGRIVRGAIEREAREAVNDAVEGAVECALGDDACVEDAKSDGQPVVIVGDDGEPIVDDAGNPVTDPAEAEKLTQRPGEGVWRNYDFTPGRTVWYVSDFSNERVGRFPTSQLGFDSGNAQIVELNGERVLEISQSTIFTISLPATLPEDFSLEFHVQTATQNMGLDVMFTPREDAWQRYDNQYLQFGASPGIYYQAAGLSSMRMNGGLSGQFYPVKLQVDGGYAVLYVGTERVANLPTANITGSDHIIFHMGGNQNYRGYIKDFVVAVGIETFYDTLTATGEFTTRGIYFDFDSDVLRPESTPTLEDIRSTLANNPDLQIVIEGHTDSQGEDDYNAELSERRARAVVAYLTANDVADSQARAVGKGASEPVADNATPEGRAENRRVVIRRAGA